MLRRFPVVLTVAVFNGLGIAASIAVTAAPSLASIASADLSTDLSTQSWPVQSELSSHPSEAFRYQRNPQRGSGRRDIIR